MAQSFTLCANTIVTYVQKRVFCPRKRNTLGYVLYVSFPIRTSFHDSQRFPLYVGFCTCPRPRGLATYIAPHMAFPSAGYSTYGCGTTSRGTRRLAPSPRCSRSIRVRVRLTAVGWDENLSERENVVTVRTACPIVRSDLSQPCQCDGRICRARRTPNP